MMTKDQQKPISGAMLLKAKMFQNQQTNILVYAVKSDDDKKTNSLKPDKSFMCFSGALTTQNLKS